MQGQHDFDEQFVSSCITSQRPEHTPQFHWFQFTNRDETVIHNLM